MRKRRYCAAIQPLPGHPERPPRWDEPGPPAFEAILAALRDPEAEIRAATPPRVAPIVIEAEFVGGGGAR